MAHAVWVCVGLACVSTVVAADKPVQTDIGQVILEAREAASRGNQTRLATLASEYATELRDHPLGAYVEFWQLSTALKSSSAMSLRDNVSAFMTRHPKTYLADRVRVEWAMALAAHAANAADGTQDWAEFARVRADIAWGGDPQLQCWTALARLHGENGGGSESAAVVEAQALVQTLGATAGDGCMRLTEVLVASGHLDLWDRVRGLVESNQIAAARRLTDRFGKSDAARLRAVLSGPARWLAQLKQRTPQATKLTRKDQAFMMIALARLSSSNPDLAARHAALLDKHLTPEQRGLVWGRIGHMAALKHAPDALHAYARGGEWVGRAPSVVRADEVLEWQVRAALRHPQGPDWALVRTVIESRMSPEQRQEPTWVYWRGRALLASDDEVAREQGQALLRTIAGQIHYYGLLAADTLGQTVWLGSPPAHPGSGLMAQFEVNPGLDRALRLYELGLRVEGHREWNWQVDQTLRPQGLGDTGLLGLAEFARARAVWDRVISTSERTQMVIDYHQRYPTPHKAHTLAAAHNVGLDPTLVYGLIRQESRFIQDVRSSAGAAGLMQLMPATARYVARREGLSDYAHTRITEPSLNLQLGTHYLRYVLDKFDGLPVLATAAYNAGPSRARAWRLSLSGTVEGAIYAETIPFNETRDYVQRVLANAVVYSAVLGEGRVPSLLARLGQVDPQGTTDVAHSDLP